MKYIAILEGDFKSLAINVVDECGNDSTVQLRPLMKEMLVTPDGRSIYLNHDDIEALLKHERDRIRSEYMESITSKLGKEIDCPKLRGVNFSEENDYNICILGDWKETDNDRK